MSEKWSVAIISALLSSLVTGACAWASLTSNLVTKAELVNSTALLQKDIQANTKVSGENVLAIKELIKVNTKTQVALGKYFGQ